MINLPSIPTVSLKVTPKSLPLFTTILQSGIEVESTTNTSLGDFLSQFEGFTADYMADTVQTIFLNGTAVDDLTLLLTGSRPVLALSGAMPGLAGAIFRKNSFHAALRTDTSAHGDKDISVEPNTVTLKLFNRIAKERGEEMLARGITTKSINVKTFFTKRPALWQHVSSIKSTTSDLSMDSFLDLVSQFESIGLNITHDDERNN